MKLILHPGHGKCGSSTLQEFLKKNLDKFEDLGIGIVNQNLELGKLRKQDWAPPTFMIQDILAGRIEPEIVKIKFEKLKDETRKRRFKAIILSCIHLLHTKRINGEILIHDEIKRTFEEVLVIYYIRRQDDFLLSAWQQWGIKRGLTFPEYIEESKLIQRPSYLKSIKDFQSIYGKEALKLGLINRQILYKGDLLTDFIHRIGLENDPFEKVSDVNISINLSYSDILRRISGYFKDQSDNHLKNLLQRNSTNAKHILFSNRKPSFFYNYSLQIMQFYEDINREIHEEFFNQYDFEELFGKNIYDFKTGDQRLPDEMEELKEVIAIQNDLIFSLISKHANLANRMNSHSRKKIKSRVRRFLKGYLD